MRGAVAAMALLLCLATAADAAPAPWYLWRSKVDAKTFCFQASPGAGWERVDGPFKDARCEKPA